MYKEVWLNIYKVVRLVMHTVVRLAMHTVVWLASEERAAPGTHVADPSRQYLNGVAARATRLARGPRSAEGEEKKLERGGE